MFGRMITPSGDIKQEIEKLSETLKCVDNVVIGAGAGLSTSAGLTYTGERFSRYFHDFYLKYHFNDMYSGGFYPYSTLEENWAYWSRHIFINRYMKAPKPVYEDLLTLVKDKNYFVLTTNVDHQFQKAGFDKEKMFYTQGDYGLFQCSRPCHKRTYDNKEKVVKMVLSQGYTIGETGELTPPTREDGELDFDRLKMSIPSDLVPYCPVCGEPMSMNLRADDTFVEDEGWHRASERYASFLENHENERTLFLELGVGGNTPTIVKFGFWKITKAWENATYACINKGEAYIPEELAERSICINSDIGAILKQL